MNDCKKILIAHKSTNGICEYRKLPKQNQLIRTSDETIFAYILNPMTLRVTCGLNSTSYNLTENTEIHCPYYCKTFKPIDNHTSHLSSTNMMIKSSFVAPSLAIYENEIWSTDIKFLNQYDIEIQNLFNDIKRTKSIYKQQSKILDVPDPSPFSYIFDYILNGISKYVFFFGILPLIIIIIISIITCTCCISCHKK